ncbi:MAG: PilW family protein [Agarilytica sp.]
MSNVRHISKCSGLTLVELLVASTIGLFIMGGVISVVVENKENFVFEQEISIMQENARFIDDELSHEIRMGGYFGCSTGAALTNTLNIDINNWMHSSQAVKGYESADAGALSGISGIKSGTDVLVINRGDPYESAAVSAHAPVLGSITTSSDHNFISGDILLVSDLSCSNSAVFEASAASGSSISHAAGGNNCRRALSTPAGDGYDCGSPPPALSIGMAYSQWSTVMRYKSSAYFIRDSVITGLPTLYRATLVRGGGVDAQELISGVEDFQVTYGMDTDAIADGNVNRYFSASDISSDLASAGSGWVGWDRVLVVRATLIMRSTKQIMTNSSDVDLGGGFSSGTYDYLSDTRYIFQKVNITSKLRNRGEAL